MKIYYYQTKEVCGGELQRFTYHHIPLETVILKVKSPFPGSVLKGEVSVMRPDLGFITKLPSFYYEVDLGELLKRVKVDEEINQNVKYLLRNVEYELGRID